MLIRKKGLSRHPIKKKLYLHIGTFKTGTSSIQKWLFENKEYLRKQGILVPAAQLVGHHELPLSLVKDYSDFRAAWPSFEGDSKTLWGSALREIDGSSCESVVITSEAFCDIFNEHCRGASKKMGDVLKKNLEKFDVKVICYVRNVSDYVSSMYGELLKVSSTRSTYFDYIKRLVENDSIHLHPTHCLGFYSDLFGKENLIVREYSKSTLVDGDVVSDFCSCLGVTPPEESRQKASRANMSIPKELWSLKRAFNASGIVDFDFNREVSDCLISSLRKEGGASEESLLEIINIEHEKVNNDYGVCLSEASDSVALPKDDKVLAQDLFVISLLGKLMKQNRVLMKRLESLEQKIERL